jgi:hypothetical protein
MKPAKYMPVQDFKQYNITRIFGIDTFKHEIHIIIFKNSVPTSKKTQRVSITNISRLTLLKEIIGVYSENHTKPLHTLCGQNAEILNTEY